MPNYKYQNLGDKRFIKWKKGTRRSKRNQEKKKTIAESLLISDALTGDIPSEIKEIHLGLLSKHSSAAASSVQPIQN